MVKPTIYLIMALLMAGTALAWSPVINQTYSEYNNLTRADNILEVAVVANEWVGGMFGIGILLVLAFVLFGISQFFTPSVSSQMLFTLFMTSVLAVLLRISGLIPDLAFYMVLTLMVAAAGMKVFNR